MNKDLSLKASGLQKCFFFLGIILKLGRPGVPGGNISLKLAGTFGVFCGSSTFSKLSLSLFIFDASNSKKFYYFFSSSITDTIFFDFFSIYYKIEEILLDK